MMKSLQPVSEDNDDIFGPPRTYPNGFTPPKNRPSMISAKYRQKEERRKVLKISMNKLKKIEDPEASLRRSVLINNTMKRLQQEAKDEKIQKQQLNYPRGICESDNFMNLRNNEVIKTEIKESIFVENDFDKKLAEEIETVKAKSIELDFETTLTSTNSANPNSNSTIPSRKRSFDDLDDCDVHDVLSQFYIPPTPRMLTCIDEDDEISVVNDEPSVKRSKIENDQSYPTSRNFNEMDFTASSFNNNNNDSSRLRFNNQNEDHNSFSCGQASMFNELQSNIYHNLIASLET